MKDSGIPWIGEIPEHWEICPLKYITAFSGGSTPDKSNLAYWNGSIPWVTPKDMKRFWIGESIEYITELAVEETSIRIIHPSVVLVVVRGMILAHSFPVALTTESLTINQDMKALVCSDKINTEFLARQLSACRDGVLSLVQEAGHGTKALRTDLFEKLSILLPSITEQKEICLYANKETKKFINLINHLKSQIEKLQEYRRSLITAAVTGKLEISEVEADV
jgi:type I restriction enzyme, S subunit